MAPFDARVDAVVAEGAPARTAADKAWLSDVYGVQGWFQRQLDTVRFGLTELLTAIAALPEQLLLVLDDYHAIESPAVDENQRGLRPPAAQVEPGLSV